MRFKLLSDLHLEFYARRPFYRDAIVEWEPKETDEDADTVLLLAGDIHDGKKALHWIDKMTKRFYHIVYILGNHEFEVNEIRDFWKGVRLNNFTFLDNDTLYLPGVRVIGGTLWTQVTNPHARWMGPKRMTDYRVTTVREQGITMRMNVGHTDKMHFETVEYIRAELEQPWEGKTIVMTHHLPHPLCVHEKWEGSDLNAFYMTDLEHIIRKYDIDAWVHGHTHDNVDVEVHETRILCNPMGYHGICLNQDFNENLCLDL